MDVHYLVWLNSLENLHAIAVNIITTVWDYLQFVKVRVLADQAFFRIVLFNMQHALRKRVTTCILEASANPTLSRASEASEKSFSKNNSEFTSLHLKAEFDFWL